MVTVERHIHPSGHFCGSNCPANRDADPHGFDLPDAPASRATSAKSESAAACGYQGFGSGDSPVGDGCVLPKDHEGPCSTSVTGCDSCCFGRIDGDNCPSSQRECGHHCNHSWSHDLCCWCGAKFGEVGAEVEGEVPSLWYLDAKARADRYADALTFIRKAASTWHGDDAAKGRALDVIARRAMEALNA